jgi:small conductance mechanosensitive channel
MNTEAILKTLAELAIVYGGRILLALFLILVGWTIAGWVSGIVRRGLTRARFDPTVTGFLAGLAWWAILVLAVLTCLNAFGVETTSFAALIGSAGIAIGLAVQGTLSNFASGIMLLVFRPFKVGDSIVVANQTGTVHEIDLFTTSLDSPDNRRFVIPNSQIFGATIENTTYHPIRRADVSVGVAYSADIDATREVLSRAVAGVPGALREPAPSVALVDLVPTAVNWQVRVWANAAQFGDVRQAVVRAVKVALDEAKIEFASQPADARRAKAAP